MCMCVYVADFKTKIVLIYYCSAELKPIRRYGRGTAITYRSSMKNRLYKDRIMT